MTKVKITFQELEDDTTQHKSVDWEFEADKQEYFDKPEMLYDHVKEVMDNWFPEYKLKRYEMILTGRRL